MDRELLKLENKSKKISKMIAILIFSTIASILLALWDIIIWKVVLTNVIITIFAFGMNLSVEYAIQKRKESIKNNITSN